MNIYLSQAFTPRELTHMALVLCDPIDLGNATPEELDRLVLAYFAAIDQRDSVPITVSGGYGDVARHHYRIGDNMEDLLARHTPGICWQCRDGGHPCDYGDTYGDCYRKGTPQLIDGSVHFYCRTHSLTIPYLLTGDITLESHMVDGFTLYALDATGHLAHRRFIDYSVHEAITLFLTEFGGPLSPDNSCPNRLGWTTDYWHECEHCR